MCYFSGTPVCLRDKIAPVAGGPVWADAAKCYGCFACLNVCPQRATQIYASFPFTSRTTETTRRSAIRTSPNNGEKWKHYYIERS
jgi:Fe-S-cluster-containing hydrogenase component 2